MSVGSKELSWSEKVLLAADTDETQAYVFESNKLPEIRGASLILRDLNKEVGDWLKGGERHCVYAAGGSLLGLVPAAEGAALATRIEAHYPRRTGAATITADWRSYPAGFEARSFGRLVQWAGHWLRSRKESKGPPPFYEVLPHQVRCQSCQKRPAVASYLSVLPDYNICRVCYMKREYQRAQPTWFSRFWEWLQKPQQEGARAAYSGSRRATPGAPQTLEEIAAASRGRVGYLALVYLDGDNIGSMLQEAKTSDAYRSISDAITHTMEHAVFQALAQHLEPAIVSGSQARAEVDPGFEVGSKVLIHPFEIITIGGDDVLLIVPAHAAVPIALDIGRDFTAGLAAAGLTATMSAGVVIADDHTPVRMLAELARQLLSESKKQAGDEGGFDFHILKSADMLDRSLDRVREAYPYALSYGGRSGSGLRLLGRPYTQSAMRQLWQGLDKVRASGLANSQMRLLAESLLDGRSQSTLTFLYQQQRLRPRGQESGPHDVLATILHELNGAGDEARRPLPWQEIVNPTFSHQTALWDLAELFEFVP